MKTRIFCFALFITLVTSTPARVVTLLVNYEPSRGPIIQTDSLSVGENEVAKVVAASDKTLVFKIIRSGVTNLSQFPDASMYPKVLAGPVTFELTGASSGWLTVEITPESFPPGQTLILPEGTVGIVHVESSTNLIQWHDEWVHTFSNTNENRFFRLRAERSLP